MLLRSGPYENYRVMMKSDQKVRTSRHYIVDESGFPMKKCSRVVLVSKVDVNKFNVD